MWYIINLIKQLCMPMNKPGWSEYQNLSVLQRVQWLSYTSGVRFPLSQIVRGDFVEVRVLMEIPQTSRTVRQESLAIWCLNTKVREQTSQILRTADCSKFIYRGLNTSWGLPVNRFMFYWIEDQVFQCQHYKNFDAANVMIWKRGPGAIFFILVTYRLSFSILTT